MRLVPWCKTDHSVKEPTASALRLCQSAFTKVVAGDLCKASHQVCLPCDTPRVARHSRRSEPHLQLPITSAVVKWTRRSSKQVRTTLYVLRKLDCRSRMSNIYVMRALYLSDPTPAVFPAGAPGTDSRPVPLRLWRSIHVVLGRHTVFTPLLLRPHHLSLLVLIADVIRHGVAGVDDGEDDSGDGAHPEIELVKGVFLARGDMTYTESSTTNSPSLRMISLPQPPLSSATRYAHRAKMHRKARVIAPVTSLNLTDAMYARRS